MLIIGETEYGVHFNSILFYQCFLKSKTILQQTVFLKNDSEVFGFECEDNLMHLNIFTIYFNIHYVIKIMST